MIDILATQSYTELPIIIKFFTYYGISFFIIINILLFGFFAFEIFKDKQYFSSIICIIIAIIFTITGLVTIHKIENHYTYNEYIAIIHDDVYYNDITSKYVIIPNKDETVILRPIEKEKVIIK